jgi:hypothetical protein
LLPHGYLIAICPCRNLGVCSKVDTTSAGKARWRLICADWI